jgi:LacI family transcriptional regulator
MAFGSVAVLLHEHPEINGIYNVAGGNAGVAEAIAQSGSAIRVISHEANHITAPLVRNGMIHYLISQDPNNLLKKAFDIASMQAKDIAKEIHFIDFGVYTRFNLPNYRTTTGEL